MEWTDILDRHGPALVLYARQWTASHADAEEAVQDGFVRLWRSPQRDGLPEAEFLPLLYVAVRSAALDLLRRQRRRASREETAAEALYAEPGPFEDTVGRQDERRVLERALAELPLDQREVIVMKLWGEMTFEQIGQALALSPNTAASRYRYGLGALRNLLQEKELCRE
jgi:RNA polymerase sigma-70 factor (ECF subfamily)